MKVIGRKHYNGENIEIRAMELLSLFEADYFQSVKATPLLKIAQFLEQKYKIIFDFEATLGFTENGQRIVGAFNPRKRIILIDSSLKDDAKKFNFTLAHEIGHLALHRNISFEREELDDKPETQETIHEFIYGTKRIKTEMEWLEWQANIYASSLLMPIKFITAALVKKQLELGISRVGKIFVDEQMCNQLDYNKLISLLSDLFNVSKSAMEYR
jgi:Zn-dependent peptidase ImmA (M78 family)